MPRYVILQHETSHEVHFDFMLEFEGVLKTWSLPQSPSLDAAMDCKALSDHRLAYLDYEGPISGDRGSVTRWDQGSCTIEGKTADEWNFSLIGEKLSGAGRLRRNAHSEDRWVLSLEAPPTGQCESR